MHASPSFDTPSAFSYYKWFIAMRRISLPDRTGYFGPFGGKFVPETVMAALDELAHAYATAKRDPRFRRRLAELLAQYAGRPTPLYKAARLALALGRITVT